LKNNGRIFEDKLQQGKTGKVTNRDLENKPRWPKARDWETEAWRTWPLWMKW